MSPLFDRLKAAGACFGELAQWERAMWFAPPGVEPAYDYSFGRQNWFPHAAEEHRAAREAVALFDLSSFAKVEVTGTDAMRLLQRVCTNDVDIPVGRLAYTLFLNPRGGIRTTEPSPGSRRTVSSSSHLRRRNTGHPNGSVCTEKACRSRSPTSRARPRPSR